MKQSFLSRFSIKTALLVFLALGVVLPIVWFSFVFTDRLSKHLLTIESESAQLTVKNNAQQLESTVESISYTAAYICNNSEISDYIYSMTSFPSSAEASFDREYLLKTIRNISNATLYSLNPDISVILPTGAVIGLDYNYKITNASIVFNTEFWDNKHCVWSNVLDDKISGDLESTWAIRDNNDIVALLRIRVPATNLWDRLGSHPLLQYRQDIINRDNIICSQDKQGACGETQLSVLEEPIKTWGMILRVTVPTKVLMQRFNKQQSLFAVCFILLIIFLLLVISIITRLITVPIQKVVSRMNGLQQGDFSKSLPQRSFKDINLLSDTLNEVAVCISGLMKTASEQATLKESMYYEALMAQINPHFLYNTLNSIRWLASINGSLAVAEMLSKLGGTLHYSFGSKSRDILLKDELCFLQDYVSLMQMRYGNAIEFEANISQELMLYKIPRFFLQPLVENSVVHGFFYIPSGKIILSAFVEKDYHLVLLLSDNGVGMKQSKADELLHSSENKYSEGSIGLNNIKRRLRLLFGSGYGISITSQEHNGCVIKMTLPIKY